MLIDAINKISDEIEDHYLEVRHNLHAHPELSYKEFRTSGKVQEELKRLGIPFELSPVKPGVIATIDSGKPGKLLLLRADMDALPIQEDSGVPFCSQNPGLCTPAATMPIPPTCWRCVRSWCGPRTSGTAGYGPYSSRRKKTAAGAGR